MVNKYYKKTRKIFKKKHEKGTKIFLKKKKKKGKKAWDRYKSLSEEEKGKKRQYHCGQTKTLSDKEK